MTPLERHCRWLLHAYPAWYRRERAGETLDTLLEASAPGRRWPSVRESRALVTGGLRVRGPLTWCMSILWATLGAAGAGYTFIASAHTSEIDTRITTWTGEPNVILDVAFLGALAWLVLTFPVVVAGFRRLRHADTRLRGAWGISWLAGVMLMVPVASWRTAAPEVWTCYRNEGCELTGYKYAVVSWGQLALFAAYLAICAAMILILRRPAGRQLRARYAPGGAAAGPDVTRPA
jgi:uncharacterized membrane protein YhaH (DUF805 family)